MQRLSTIAIVAVFLLSAVCAQASDVVMEKLKTIEAQGLIYNIRDTIDAGSQDQDAAHAYIFYFNSPIESPVSENMMPIRAVLITNNKLANPLEAPMNQVYIYGYGLEDDLNSLSRYKIVSDNFSELAYRYGGNVLLIEHRYYDASVYDGMWNNLEYLNATMVAEDYHRIVTILREKLFAPGSKLVFGGVSEGGINASIQAVKHPEDAELFLAYVAPWCRGLYDERPITYVNEQSFRQPKSDDDESYSIFKRVMNYFSSTPSLRKEYEKWHKAIYPNKPFDEATYAYHWNEMAIFFAMYVPRSYINKNFKNSNKGWDDNRWALNILTTGFLSNSAYADSLAKYPEAAPDENTPKSIRRDSEKHDSVTKEVFTTAESFPFYYQAKTETGYYCSLCMDNYYPDTDLGQQYMASDKEDLQKYYNLIDEFCPGVKDFTYSDDNYNEVMAGTLNTEKPLYYFYGADDFWTGAAIDDQYINGTTSRKWILPYQNHSACITNAEADTQSEIWALIDGVLGMSPSGINNIATPSTTSKTVRKVIHNGRIIIDGKYAITGQRVK